MRLLNFQSVRYRVFRDFAWSEDLSDFADFNLIYSPNGSGKSTLAGILRQISDGEPLSEGSAVLSTDRGRVRISSTVAPVELRDHVRVFDPEYRAKNLDHFAGIRWTIGEDAVQAAAEIDRQKANLVSADDAIGLAEISAQSATRDLEAFCDKTATELRGLKRLLQGQGAATYSKAVLRTNLNNLDAAALRDLVLLDVEAEAKRTLLHDRTVLPHVDLSHSIGPIDLSPLANAANDLQSEAIAAAGERDPTLSGRHKWLSQGIQYLDAEASSGCPFCGQGVPHDRERKLRETLSDRYEDLARRARDVQIALDAADVELRALGLPAPTVVVATKRQAFMRAVAAVDESLPDYRRVIRDIKERLALVVEGGSQEPFPPLTYSGSAHVHWAQLQAIIDEHNAEIAVHEKACKDAFDDLEADMLSRSIEQYSELVVKDTNSSRDLAELQALRHGTMAELRRAEGSVQRIDQAVDLLNDDLSAYLGHPHIRVEILDDGYQILREGIPAAEVSEGERTAITLLHFLRSLEDEQFQRDEGLVVIDDPVSSLDSTALHSAAAFLIDAIYDREANCVRGQVMVTTHNFAFFRLLRDWAMHLRKSARKFYTINTVQIDDGRSSELRPIDPLLLQFNSEYHFLFAKVFGYSGGEESLYILNLARRLLEAFLAFRIPSLKDLRRQLDKLLEETEGIGSEQQQRLRMLFNTGSHAAAIPDVSDQLAQIDEVPHAIEALTTLMRAADARHCEQMIDLCASRR